jgi:hypothetical protein
MEEFPMLPASLELDKVSVPHRPRVSPHGLVARALLAMLAFFGLS